MRRYLQIAGLEELLEHMTVPFSRYWADRVRLSARAIAGRLEAKECQNRDDQKGDVGVGR